MKPRVLQLIESFRVGGSESQAVQLTRLLRESGRYSVHVACLGKTGPLLAQVERLELGEIPEFPLTSFYNRNAAVQVRRFARHLRDRKIDLVHTHDFYTNIFGMAGARLAGVPVRIASRRESGKRAALKRFLERRAYGVAHRVVANCEEVRRQLIAEGVAPDKVVTLYNGLDRGRVEPPAGVARAELLARLGLPGDVARRFVTVVANLREVKDHATFLRAAAQVLRAAPHVSFVLAGEGPEAADLRALSAGLGLGGATYFLGRCQEVASLLAVSDVCVLSSRSEGFSNAILEYMAAGRPVVATDVGGAREAVVEGETGYLVPAGDDRAMAERLITLLRDPARAQAVGQRGRAVIEQRFSCERQLERAENLYAELLGPAASPVQQPLASVQRNSA